MLRSALGELALKAETTSRLILYLSASFFVVRLIYEPGTSYVYLTLGILSVVVWVSMAVSSG